VMLFAFFAGYAIWGMLEGPAVALFARASGKPLPAPTPPSASSGEV